MATCCAALGVPNDERDVLGRWVRRKSDRYDTVARLQRLQVLVALTPRSRSEAAAVIGEHETWAEIEEFLKARGVSQQSSLVVTCSDSTECRSNEQRTDTTRDRGFVGGARRSSDI